MGIIELSIGTPGPKWFKIYHVGGQKRVSRSQEDNLRGAILRFVQTRGASYIDGGITGYILRFQINKALGIGGRLSTLLAT